MRNAILLLTLGVSLLASHAVAATLVLEVDSAVASIDPTSQKPTLTVVWKRESRVAEAEFKRLRVGEEVTMRLGDQLLIKSVVSEPIIQGVTSTLAGFPTYEVVRKMERDIRSGNRAFLLDGSDK